MRGHFAMFAAGWIRIKARWNMRYAQLAWFFTARERGPMSMDDNSTGEEDERSGTRKLKSPAGRRGFLI